MSKLIEIKTTFSNDEKAISIINKITKLLLQEKLASCIQTSKINSYYCWPKGTSNIKNDEEILLIIKAKIENYQKIAEIILENHEYDLPQIIFNEIAGGYEPFIKWLKNN